MIDFDVLVDNELIKRILEGDNDASGAIARL